MAGLNVAEWSPDQVAEWLSGLGPSVAQYVPALRARGLDGVKLLTLRCDDLEYLGMHVIGHQELLLEAVEHLRNFQYELSRECIQQLALRVSVVATTLARALRHHTDARLETQILADVARTVHAVKPLVCWLDRWSLGGGALAARRAELLQLSLEAATCAQRDRFAEQPARAVGAAAAATAAAATYIVQEVADPGVLQPAALAGVSLRARGRALGLDVRPSFCGHQQLAHIRFGSPAHASGAVHAGDEIVQVGGQCVIGWSGAAVERACGAAAAGGELALRLRRRAARPPPALPRRPPRHALYVDHRVDRNELSVIRGDIAAASEAGAAESAASSSDESEPLSPPASPTHLHGDHARMYPAKPRALVQRRHTISCGAPVAKPPTHTIEQLWRRLRAARGGAAREAEGRAAPHDDVALYARDKAVSYSTGLELAPRPRTVGAGGGGGGGGASPPASPRGAGPGAGAGAGEAARGKLDKAHSTPAYDLEPAAGAARLAQAIPESPTTPVDSPTVLVHSAEKADQILEFKKSSSQIGEAMQQRRAPDDKDDKSEFIVEGTGARDESTTEKILETINIAMMEHRRRSLLEGPRITEPSRNLKLSASDCGTKDVDTEEKINAPRYSYLRTTRRASPPPSPPPRAPSAPVPRAPAAPTAPTPRAPAAPTPRAPAAHARGPAAALPVLRAVPRPQETEPTSPMKPRLIDATQISIPLRHITKHDIRMIPAEGQRDLPAINAEPAAASPTSAPAPADIVLGAQAGDARGTALSPTSAVRGIFPTSKSRSLKKKSSILAKRRCVPCRAVAARGAAGGVWQRVRARSHAAQPRWVRRHLLLTHNLLYAYKTPECAKADCMIYLEGCTVCAAGEVKSRAHAFKVYHTGNAFYFACHSRDAMLAWIQLIHRATLLPSLLSHVDVARQFSETDYSETESDNDSPEKRNDKDKDKDKDKEKDKSKFGSLKKLTVRMQRSESQENVSHSSTSLDRKYLRFFSRHKSKDDTKPKNKQSNVPVPTEHYRSYRRVGAPQPAPAPAPSPSPTPGAAPAAGDRMLLGSELRASKKIPKPINYIHASNPNLLDFEKSDFVTKPTLQVPSKPKVTKPESLLGLVTLEQFMLKKQEEERRQLYSNRVLLGIERDRKQLQQRLHRIVPDVIYGEVCAAPPDPAPAPAPAPPPAPAPLSTASYKERRPEPGKGKPISVKGKDGYEKIVYTDDPPDAGSDSNSAGYEGYGVAGGVAREWRPPPPLAPERWRDSLRRNDKVHSAPAAPRDTWNNSGGEGGEGGAGGAGGAAGGAGGAAGGAGAAAGPGVSRLRLMFGGGRAAHAQSPQPARGPAAGGAVGAGGAGGAGGAHYPHLQCPPTFQPESYSLAAPPRRPDAREP